MTEFTKVSGSEEPRDVKMYTISTCAWCKKTKRFMKENNIEHRYIDIDDLEGEEKDEIMEELENHNPTKSVPTIIIDEGEEVIVGFKEDKLKETLNLD